MERSAQFDYDVAIIGGGPAGLSAAIVLGRARRRVVVIDHGQPRNYAAQTVNCYLGLEGLTPQEFRERGRKQARHYGVEFLDTEAKQIIRCEEPPTCFRIATSDGSNISVRKLLLATGTRDVLPSLANLTELYGKSVHHCPYCDGWEHRDERLVAWGESTTVVSLALELKTWSASVTACSHGQALDPKELAQLHDNHIDLRSEPVVRLEGAEGRLREIIFASGPPLPCDALFFSAGQHQCSHLPESLGVNCDEQGLVRTTSKQGTGVPGLFLAGDADGDVQFAIVAAAEGAIAGTAINQELQQDDSTCE